MITVLHLHNDMRFLHIAFTIKCKLHLLAIFHVIFPKGGYCLLAFTIKDNLYMPATFFVIFFLKMVKLYLKIYMWVKNLTESF